MAAQLGPWGTLAACAGLLLLTGAGGAALLVLLVGRALDEVDAADRVEPPTS